MRKGLLLVGLLVILAAGMVRAGDDDGTAKPGTPEDNECNPGGVLYREENQDGCPTEWYWKAGWYLARYNRGLLSRADFPKEFDSVLPSEIEGVCWHRKEVNGSSGNSVLYIGPANQIGNAQWHVGNLTCSNEIFINPDGVEFIIFAEDATAARALCATFGVVFMVPHFNSNEWFDAPPDAYECHVFL